MRTTTTATRTNNSMLFTTDYTTGRQANEIGAVRQHLAEALVGKAVDLLHGRAVAHGIVSGVLLFAGNPKLLVNGRMYDMNQVLTATPA
jgi:hypothetical protein